MPVLAADRFLVRFGELRFAELVLEAFSAMGFDALELAALGTPVPPAVSAVIEIVDRADERVVRRIRDDVDVIDELFALVSRDLRRLDAAAFEAAWTATRAGGL